MLDLRDLTDERRVPSAPVCDNAQQRETVARRFIQNLFPSLVSSFTAASKLLLVTVGLTASILFLSLAILRTVNPPSSAVMLADRVSGVTVDQRWVPLEDISANLVRAVIASEDVRFCQHNGVDPQELENAFQRAKRDGLEQVRGASTITMQVAKNLFLTNERSLLRKGLELGVALAIDKVWSKRRTMEVYLNIAEWGEGIYGAEAAARHHFGKSAKRLTEAEAALLAVSLPNPEARVAGRPSRVMQKLAGRIRTRKDQVPGAHMCVYP